MFFYTERGGRFRQTEDIYIFIVTFPLMQHNSVYNTEESEFVSFEPTLRIRVWRASEGRRAAISRVFKGAVSRDFLPLFF